MSATHRRPRARWQIVMIVSLAVAISIGVLVALAGRAGQAHTSHPSTPETATSAASTPPVWAYFYQWYTKTSWNRAKSDLPLAGPYSSDSINVLRNQVRQARSSGLDGFLTSWKDTPALDRRLGNLVQVAGQNNFDVGIVYEALDFDRNPLPIATVKHDMLTLVNRWGTGLRSSFGKPVIIWTGTEQYSRPDVEQVRDALGSRALLLAAAKSVAGYQNIADLVDGEAYYWSSANPTSPSTSAKLTQMSAAVHAHDGIWIAPAAPGFDGTTLGHTRVIARHGGATLQTSLTDAFASKPDAVGVISWNEWSENTYIEPGHQYGNQDLTVLRADLTQRRGVAPPGSLNPASKVSYGLRLAGELAAMTLLGLALLGWISRRRHLRWPHRVTSIDQSQPMESPRSRVEVHH